MMNISYALDETITDALKTAFESVQTDFTSVLTIALPIALGIMAVVLAVKLGIRFFKSTAK